MIRLLTISIELILACTDKVSLSKITKKPKIQNGGLI